MTVTAADYTGPKEWVALHNHSVYSPLDGVATVPQYARTCLERGYPGMALTEHGNMASVPELYTTFREKGLVPVIGCEIYLNDDEPKRKSLGSIRALRKTDFEAYTRVARNRHLTVLAKNETGYHNLIKLTTQAFQTGLFGVGRVQYPRIWFDKLCEFREGLIVLSGCLNGPLSHALRTKQIIDPTGKPVREFTLQERMAEALRQIKQYRAAFGDDYYIELQQPGVEGDVEVFRTSVMLADRYDIKTTITNDIHYLTREEHELQKIMMAIAQGVTVDSPDLFHVNSSEQYFKTRGELWATFRNGGYSRGFDDGVFEAACDNTLEVLDKCRNLTIDTSPKIPDLPNADNELCRLAVLRLRELGFDKEPRKFLIDGREVTYSQQTKIELERVIDKGFSSYFLITMKLVQYGKGRGWPFSPRGSAGGSLLCFLLGISSINSCLWGLSFDRFLSPARGGFMLDMRMRE